MARVLLNQKMSSYKSGQPRYGNKNEAFDNSVKEYKLSDEELEKYRNGEKGGKTMIKVRKKEEYLELHDQGLTDKAIRDKWEIDHNTLHKWKKGWDLVGKLKKNYANGQANMHPIQLTPEKKGFTTREGGLEDKNQKATELLHSTLSAERVAQLLKHFAFYDGVTVTKLKAELGAPEETVQQLLSDMASNFLVYAKEDKYYKTEFFRNYIKKTLKDVPHEPKVASKEAVEPKEEPAVDVHMKVLEQKLMDSEAMVGQYKSFVQDYKKEIAEKDLKIEEYEKRLHEADTAIASEGMKKLKEIEEYEKTIRYLEQENYDLKNRPQLQDPSEPLEEEIAQLIGENEALLKTITVLAAKATI